MSVKLPSLPTIAAIIAAIAGAVGTVLTPILGAGMTTAIQAILQALSGLLLAIPMIGAVHTASAQAKMRYSTNLEIEKAKKLSELRLQVPGVAA